MFFPRKIRKIVKLFRGQVSPTLVGLAVGLGFWFGLMPGFSGLHAALLIALVLLNIPIGLFLLSAALGKALCLAAAPAWFHIGGFVQAYLGWLLSLLSRIPIVGLSDFARPALAGTIFSGPVIGFVLGFIAGQIVLGFRRTWLKLESNSEKFAKWQEKGWVRFLDWLLVGKRAKNAREAMEFKTVYLRKAGAIFVVLVIALLIGLVWFVKNELIRDTAAEVLTKANGAKVDIAQVELAPTKGNIAVEGICVTDRQKPTQNQVQIGEISAKADVYSLSVGKLIMDQVKVSEILFDQPRQTPGEVLPEEEPQDTFDPKDFGLEDITAAKIEEYFEKAKTVRDWLGKIRRWLPESKEQAEKPTQEAPHKYLDYLTARAQVAPIVKMLARNITADKVDIPLGQFGVSTINLTNLSNAPRAAKLPMGLEIRSLKEDGPQIKIDWHFDDPDQAGMVTGTFSGLDLGQMQSGLASQNALDFQSGTLAGTFKGTLNQQVIDLTVDVKVNELAADSSKGLFGMDAKTTDEVFAVMKDLDLSVRMVGPVTQPRLIFDSKALSKTFQDKLIEAGKQRLANEMNQQLEKALGDNVPAEVKEIIKPETITEGLKGLFGEKKKQ
ncbi:MAG: hypothetical protein JXA82_04605 [Sedimentisphaerales bacterium]|nr:hypothetical protein [Sedimentisphaerales bacterium]